MTQSEKAELSTLLTKKQAIINVGQTPPQKLVERIRQLESLQNAGSGSGNAKKKRIVKRIVRRNVSNQPSKDPKYKGYTVAEANQLKRELKAEKLARKSGGVYVPRMKKTSSFPKAAAPSNRRANEEARRIEAAKKFDERMSEGKKRTSSYYSKKEPLRIARENKFRTKLTPKIKSLTNMIAMHKQGQGVLMVKGLAKRLLKIENQIGASLKIANEASEAIRALKLEANNLKPAKATKESKAQLAKDMRNIKDLTIILAKIAQKGKDVAGFKAKHGSLSGFGENVNITYTPETFGVLNRIVRDYEQD